MYGWKNLYSTAGDGELYDLHEDPMELRNRANDPACGDRRDLTERLLRWQRVQGDDVALTVNGEPGGSDETD